MGRTRIWIAIVVASSFRAQASPASNINLGTAGSFGVLGASEVTNSGFSNVFGNVGVWSGSSITGFPVGSISGTVNAGDGVAMQAQMDLTAAYNAAAVQSCAGANALTGQDLGGLNLAPGVYCFTSTAQLTGSLTLDAQGDPNAVFIFQIGSSLTTASNSAVLFANDSPTANVYWQIVSSATLGTDTTFWGNILALDSITLNTGASIQCGSALAQTGTVTLDTNSVDTGNCQSVGAVPEPAAGSLFAAGLLLGLIKLARNSR